MYVIARLSLNLRISTFTYILLKCLKIKVAVTKIYLTTGVIFFHQCGLRKITKDLLIESTLTDCNNSLQC